MTPEHQLILEWIGTVPVLVPNWEKRLPLMYEDLNAKWFENSLPPISDEFVCEFCDMPRDTTVIYIDEKDAAEQSTSDVKIRPGIRISSGLKMFRAEVTIALLHEMVHATGIRKHDEPFRAQIARLMAAGAYEGLL
jgi:hypothetical protein